MLTSWTPLTAAVHLGAACGLVLVASTALPSSIRKVRRALCVSACIVCFCVSFPPAHEYLPFRQVIVTENRRQLQCPISSKLPLPQTQFEWCLWIRSRQYNIHACYNTTGVVSYTPDAAKANLLDIVQVPKYPGIRVPYAVLVRLNPIVHRAYMTCSVRNENYSAIVFMWLRLQLSGK